MFREIDGVEHSINAIAFRDVFDRKSGAKLIRTFETGSDLEEATELCKTWVMIRRPLENNHNKNNFIFHPERCTINDYENDLDELEVKAFI